MLSPIFLSPRQRSSHAVLLIGILTIFSLLLAACGGGSPTTTTATTANVSIAPPNDLLTSGVLTVGSDTTYPPKEYIDTTTGKATGFDIDLITAMAERMGLHVNVVTTTFDTIITSLMSKRFDVVISSVYVTPARQQKLDFVNVVRSGDSFLVQKGNPQHIQGYTNLCGKKVGVQRGTILLSRLQDASKACTQNGQPAIDITILENQTDVVQLLVTKRVDATLQTSDVTSYYLKQNPGMFDIGGSITHSTIEGIVIRKGDTSMLTAMQKSFDAVRADGTYSKLLAKWYLQGESL